MVEWTGRAASWIAGLGSCGVYVVVVCGWSSRTGGAEECSWVEQSAPPGSSVRTLVHDGTGFTRVVVMALERVEPQDELVRQVQRCLLDVDNQGSWALDSEGKWQQMEQYTTTNVRRLMSPYVCELCLRRLEAETFEGEAEKLEAKLREGELRIRRLEAKLEEVERHRQQQPVSSHDAGGDSKVWTGVFNRQCRHSSGRALSRLLKMQQVPSAAGTLVTRASLR